MIRYMRVTWHHDLDEEPVQLISEIANGVETRKVEIYRDGRMDLADELRSTGTTRLSEVLMPSLEEIRMQDEFSPEEINRDEFETFWRTALESSD